MLRNVGSARLKAIASVRKQYLGAGLSRLLSGPSDSNVTSKLVATAGKREDLEIRRRAWFRNVPVELDSDSIAKWLMVEGKLVKLLTKEDAEGDTRRVYAQFQSEKEAKRAVLAVNGRMLNDKKIQAFLSLDMSKDGADLELRNTVIVSNVPWDVEAKDLEKWASNYGPVSNMAINRIRWSLSEGCTAYIEFVGRREAEEAVSKMNDNPYFETEVHARLRVE